MFSLCLIDSFVRYLFKCTCWDNCGYALVPPGGFDISEGTKTVDKTPLQELYKVQAAQDKFYRKTTISWTTAKIL